MSQNGHFTAGRCVRRAFKSFQPILEEKLNSFSTYLIVFSLIAVSEYKDANVNN